MNTLKDINTWGEIDLNYGVSMKADRNLIESIKTRAENLELGEVIESDKYIIFTIGKSAEDGHLNGAICLDDNYARETLRVADDFFQERQLDYIIWVRDGENIELESYLKGNGYEPKREPGSAAMVVDKKIEGRVLPGEYREEIVKDEKSRRDFAQIVSSAFEKDLDLANYMFSEEKSLLGENVISRLIYKGDKPVGSAMTVASGDTAGIYWVGVLEECRGDGIGAYLVQSSTNQGFDMGAKSVILQASKMGEPIYKKLGYDRFKYYRWYTMESFQEEISF